MHMLIKLQNDHSRFLLFEIKNNDPEVTDERSESPILLEKYKDIQKINKINNRFDMKVIKRYN